MLQQLLERPPNPNTPNDNNAPAPTNRDGVEGVALDRPRANSTSTSKNNVAVSFDSGSKRPPFEKFGGLKVRSLTVNSTSSFSTSNSNVADPPDSGLQVSIAKSFNWLKSKIPAAVMVCSLFLVMMMINDRKPALAFPGGYLCRLYILFTDAKSSRCRFSISSTDGSWCWFGGGSHTKGFEKYFQDPGCALSSTFLCSRTPPNLMTNLNHHQIDSPRQEQQHYQRCADLLNRQSWRKVFGMAAANPQPLREWRYRSKTRTAEHGMVVAAATTSKRHNR
ncbi:hypothetical protein LWI28_005186 [Acer negundo]|uniref:Uncharacterized protein n=1 Tax=Acer negundo TaxID=4023 RepID=A0AAD5IIH6_ACENE|nr:hypothetical protein LWI28_005186 [Acer negundo]